METEIRYSHKILSEILLDYESDTEFKNFLLIVLENLKSKMFFYEAWKESVKKIPNSYGLLNQDKELILRFGEVVGTTDVNGQIAICRLNKSLVCSALENAKEEKIKKSKLYFMLSSSLGMCIAIILL